MDGSDDKFSTVLLNLADNDEDDKTADGLNSKRRGTDESHRNSENANHLYQALDDRFAIPDNNVTNQSQLFGHVSANLILDDKNRIDSVQEGNNLAISVRTGYNSTYEKKKQAKDVLETDWVEPHTDKKINLADRSRKNSMM